MCCGGREGGGSLAHSSLQFSQTESSSVQSSPFLRFRRTPLLYFHSHFDGHHNTPTTATTSPLPLLLPALLTLNTYTHSHMVVERERERELEEERLYNSPCSSASAITSTIPQLCKHYQLSVSSRRRLNQQGEAVQ